MRRQIPSEMLRKRCSGSELRRKGSGVWRRLLRVAFVWFVVRCHVPCCTRCTSSKGFNLNSNKLPVGKSRSGGPNQRIFGWCSANVWVVTQNYEGLFTNSSKKEQKTNRGLECCGPKINSVGNGSNSFRERKMRYPWRLVMDSRGLLEKSTTAFPFCMTKKSVLF